MDLQSGCVKLLENVMKRLLIALIAATAMTAAAGAAQAGDPFDGMDQHLASQYDPNAKPDQYTGVPDSSQSTTDKRIEPKSAARAPWFAIDENTGVCTLLRGLMPAETPQQAEFLMQASGLNVMAIWRSTRLVSIISKDNSNLGPFTITNDLESCRSIVSAAEATRQR